jgi:hypothetical protein
MGFQVLTAASMKMTAFRDAVLCDLEVDCMMLYPRRLSVIFDIDVLMMIYWKKIFFFFFNTDSEYSEHM